MKIINKLLSGFLLIASMVFLVGFMNLKVFRASQASFDLIGIETIPLIEIAENLKVAGLRIVASTSEYGFIKAEKKAHDELRRPGAIGTESEESEESELVQDGEITFDAGLTQLEVLVREYHPEKMDDIALIAGLGRDLRKTSREIIEMKDQDVSGYPVLVKKEEFEDLERSFLKQIDSLIVHGEQEYEQKKIQITEAIDLAASKSKLMTSLAFIISVIAGLIISRSISNPVSNLTNMADKVSGGDLDARADENATGEIGVLARTFNRMLDDIGSYHNSLLAANEKFKELLAKSQTNLKVRFFNDNLVKCWETKNCGIADCPCYGSDDLRCWLKVGTYCGEEQYSNIAEKIRHCESCEVYLSATNDPIRSIGEQFNTLMRVLEQRATELDVARMEAEKASKAKSEFLANMSHEIRTPLNGITGMVDLAMEVCTDDELKGFLTTVNNEVQALLSIINDILDFSKIEAGKLELEEISFDLIGLFDNIASANALEAFSKSLELVSFVEPGTPAKLVGDPGRLRQILMNLINNSLKFTQEGEIIVTAEIVEELGDFVRIKFQVKDTGIGIPAEKQKKIFESFTQADGSTTRKYGGTGLGTSICKHLVEMMDGEIGLESAEGKGANFWFTIQFRRQDPEEAKIDPIEDWELQGLRILIVDDNYNNLNILESYSKSWGCFPETVSGGKGALKMLEDSIKNDSPYNLVLTDHHMPGMSGFELVEEIRKKAGIADIPIVMFTSAGNPGDGKRCREEGINGYLSKPIRSGDLKNTIKMVLGFAGYNNDGTQQELVTKHLVSEKFGSLDSVQRVLLVEDYLTNQQVATLHLKGVGFEVDLAENGEEAVEAYRSQSYDVVLMDIQMPVMDGYEATKLIREMEKGNNKRTPIIAMTAHASKENRDKCLQVGMDDFIVKPVKRIVLFNKIFKWLENGDGIVAQKSQYDEKLKKNNKSATPSSPMDFERALEEFNGDESLLFQVAEEFVRSAYERIGLIDIGLSKGDGETVKREGHTLKGGGGYVCADRAVEIAYGLENAGNDRDFNLARSLSEEFKTELGRLSEFVDDRKNVAAS